MKPGSTILFIGIFVLGAVVSGLTSDAIAQLSIHPTTRARPQAGHGTMRSDPDVESFTAGSHAPSGTRAPPSDGGAIGTVVSLSVSGFTVATKTGLRVLVETLPSTTYHKGKMPTPARAIALGAYAAVLGKVSFGTQPLHAPTITASAVIVQADDVTSNAMTIAPFIRQAPDQERREGNIPVDYVEGEGTIVNGSTANIATEAALTSPYYGGGLINRVVQLQDGTYEVHNVAVPWPHHIFVNGRFNVVGAF